MKTIYALILGLLVITACNRTKKTEDGIEYKKFRTDENARTVVKGDMLLIHMRGAGTSKDTVLFDSYKNDKPYYIPAEEATLKSMFYLMNKGDSVEFTVSADSLFQKSFGAPRPPSFPAGEMLKFTVSLVDIYNQAEMQKKIEEQNTEFMVKDSIALASFLQSNTNIQSTSTGLKYEVLKAGKGKVAKKGDKVTVRYRGTLLDGKVFDETKPGQPDFTFSVGLGQVITGWDEGLQLMKEGSTYRLIIPWKLAYGPRGSGPIPPYATLVFEVELLKVN